LDDRVKIDNEWVVRVFLHGGENSIPCTVNLTVIRAAEVY